MLQVYIVTGGLVGIATLTASTETLLKVGGTAWKSAANLPSARTDLKGLGLNNGRFMVVGGGYQNNKNEVLNVFLNFRLFVPSHIFDKLMK